MFNQKRRRIFNRLHQLAILSERDYLRSILNDPTIRYTGERNRRNNQYVFTFISNREYRIEHLFSDKSTSNKCYFYYPK